MNEPVFEYDESANRCVVLFGAHRVEVEPSFVFEMLTAMIIELSPRFPIVAQGVECYKEKIEMHLFDLMTQHFGLKASDIHPKMNTSPLREVELTLDVTCTERKHMTLSIFQK